MNQKISNMLKQLVKELIKSDLPRPLTNNEIACITDIVMQNLEDNVRQEVDKYLELSDQEA